MARNPDSPAVERVHRDFEAFVELTGADGQIGYALLFRIASGEMLGKDQPVVLQLLEIPDEKAQKALKGVMMELDDCAFPLLQGMVLTSDLKEGFKDVNWALLVGSKPRGPGMERADLLKDNGRIFITQGQIIDQVAADNARVAVVVVSTPQGQPGQGSDLGAQPGMVPAHPVEQPVERVAQPGELVVEAAVALGIHRNTLSKRVSEYKGSNGTPPHSKSSSRTKPAIKTKGRFRK